MLHLVGINQIHNLFKNNIKLHITNIFHKHLQFCPKKLGNNIYLFGQ